jgi:hypothetical protein
MTETSLVVYFGREIYLPSLMPGIVTKCDISRKLPSSRIGLLAKQQRKILEGYGNVQKLILVWAIASKGENCRKKGGLGFDKV